MLKESRVDCRVSGSSPGSSKGRTTMFNLVFRFFFCSTCSTKNIELNKARLYKITNAKINRIFGRLLFLLY